MKNEEAYQKNEIKYMVNSKGQKIAPYKSHYTETTKPTCTICKVFGYAFIIGIILCIIMLFSSCSVYSVYPTHSLTKTVINKDRDNYSYLIALDDGSTYYASFGEYSVINIGDALTFKSRKQTRIINIIKLKK